MHKPGRKITWFQIWVGICRVGKPVFSLNKLYLIGKSLESQLTFMLGRSHSFSLTVPKTSKVQNTVGHQITKWACSLQELQNRNSLLGKHWNGYIMLPSGVDGSSKCIDYLVRVLYYLSAQAICSATLSSSFLSKIRYVKMLFWDIYLEWLVGWALS